uniref:Uncharacterized protein n=1 Tax=Ammopiptanthus mongolicus TaxID=126911 RepID=A0A4P8PGS1_AMMMO|nr:hypothetical protein [Ammopiptanthus mongolicus]
MKTFSIPTSSPQPQSLVDIMGLLIPCLWMGTCLLLTSPPELIQPISQSAFPFTLPLFPFYFSGLGLAQMNCLRNRSDAGWEIQNSISEINIFFYKKSRMKFHKRSKTFYATIRSCLLSPLT